MSHPGNDETRAAQARVPKSNIALEESTLTLRQALDLINPVLLRTLSLRKLSGATLRDHQAFRSCRYSFSWQRYQCTSRING